MKFSNPGIWIGILSTLGVVALAVRDLDKTAPGDLSAVHGRMDDLAGAENCSQCHGGWGVSMADACLECHETIGAQVEADSGLHGEIGLRSEPVCGLCHGEHHGESWALVNAQSFAMSGAGSVEDFDHNLVGFRMDGGHLELSCTECHEHAEEEVLTEGAQRFGGLDQSCTACHEDHHEGKMVIDCTSCHGQVAFDQLDSFGHEEFLPLEGGHERLDCFECHEVGSEFSLGVIGHGLFEEDERSCIDCHDQPHRKKFIRSVATRAEVPVGESCSECHLAEHKGFVVSRASVSEELHALTGFALDDPHREISCRECHGKPGTDFGLAHPNRLATDCAACHDDPHDGQFDGELGAAKECIDCHGQAGFEPHAFTVEMHAESDLVLRGSHLKLDCHACHADPDGNEARSFSTMKSACEACHEDAHEAFFREYLEVVDEKRFEARAERANPAGCEVCHDATEFSEYSKKRFNHGASTGLEVSGAHAQTDCETCHPRAEDADLNGRTFGWVQDHFGEFKGCVTCHEDPHQGQFDGAEFPAVVAGGADCARCHESSSFRALSNSFVHGDWTHYPLDGRHAELDCSACHDPLRMPDESGRTWGRAAGTTCADCHADPHAGQFVVDQSISCERCHESASEFEQLIFDHDRDSPFRLGDAHAELNCGVCHPAVPTSGGLELVRYRPLQSECVDCHGVQRDRGLLGGRDED